MSLQSLAFLLTVLVIVAWTWRGRSRGLASRPVLLGFLALSLSVPILGITMEFGALGDTYVRLSRPEWSSVVPIATLAWIDLTLHHRTSVSKVRARLLELTFGYVVFALALLIVGLSVGRKSDRMTVIVAVDRSLSMGLVEDAEARVLGMLKEAETSMREDDQIGTIAFARTAVTEQPLRKKGQPVLSQEVVIEREGTDLELAIRRAIADLPEGSAARVVVITDGVANRGDAFRGASVALSMKVPLDFVVLDQSHPSNVEVVSVRGPIRGNSGEDADLKVVARATEQTEVVLRVKRDGKLIREGTVTLPKGEEVLRIREQLPEAGLHRYDVELSSVDRAIDASPDDNVASAFIRVRGESSVLILEGEPADAAYVARTLESASFLVDVRGASGVPADLSGLAPYDLVVLSNIAASRLTPAQIESIAAYVTDFGGGLLLLGGEGSMGPGGYGKTPIEEVSPVSFDLRQDERRGSLAEVIAIDISGSMSATVGGKTKLELANDAAVRAAELLGPGDQLGVEHVDTEVHWTVPLAPLSGDKAKVSAAIRSMPVGGGGILVPITLAEGYDALRRSNVSVKHLLLLADGGDAEEMANAKPLTMASVNDKITTSVVALGRGGDVADLEEMARIGGGRFYLIEDASQLPAVFAQETVLAARSAIVEKPFVPTLVSPGQPCAGVVWGASPALGGYVVTQPKPRATLHLQGPEGDPIFASWSVGVGRSGAFMSDLKERWGKDFTRWPGSAKMLVQTARDLVRKGDDGPVQTEAEAAGGRLKIHASATGEGGRAQNFRRLTAKVVGPGGFESALPLEPSHLGRYSAELPLGAPGAYVVMTLDESTGELLSTTGAVLTKGDEMRPTGSDRVLAGRLASGGQGALRDSLVDLFVDRTTPRFTYEDASGWLSLSAALALLLGVAARRLSLPERLFLRRKVAPQVGGVRSEETLVAVARRAAESRSTGSVGAAPVPAPPGSTEAAPPAPRPAPVAAPPARRTRLTGTHSMLVGGPPQAPPAPPIKPPTRDSERSTAEILAERKRRKGG